MVLEDFLQFATGSRIISPVEETTIEIAFIETPLENFPRPKAHTCSRKLTVTLALDYETMRDAFVDSIAQLSEGFTVV